MRIAALLVASHDTTILYRPIGAWPVVRHAAEALLGHVEWLQPIGDVLRLGEALGPDQKILPAIAGAATRRETVRLGLEALAALPTERRPDLVLVHDADRPCVPFTVTQAVIAALADHKGAVPGVPASDSIKRGDDGRITETVAPGQLYRIQTPQGFDFATLRDVYRAAGDDGSTGVDDAELLRRAGIHVVLVAGSHDNIKLIDEEDVMRLERLIAPSLVPRTGTGFDVHAFGDPRALMLCGIEVPFERGLAGHSDADVGLHALCDAIYGALAEGDIGRHFPPGEADWKDADSARFLVHAGERIAARDGVLINADVTLICERPKIGPHADAMRARLAELLRVDIGRISVKATTTERLGFTGRGEGIACQASASILLPF